MFDHKALFFLIVVLLTSCGYKNQNERKTIPPNLLHPKDILLLYDQKMDTADVGVTKRHLQRAFGLSVILEPSPGFPQSLRSVVHKDRYRADSILNYLEETDEHKGRKLIMLMTDDISTTKYSNFEQRKIKLPVARYTDWAIFGLGHCPGYCCVVSVKRLWTGKASRATYLNRLKNISVHEVGHTFGLPHCPEPQCVMNDANETILTVDRSTGTFCEKCKLQMDLNK